MMVGIGDISASTSIKQPAHLLNVPFKYFAEKSSYTDKHSQKYDHFYKKISVTDSEINYKFLEEIEEAQGSSAYINRNDIINFGVVLAGIHAVICKEHHLKVCELVMNMLDVLLGLAVISSTEDEEKFQLAVDITLRLGCSHCQLRGRSFIADQLRGKVHLLLNKLRLLNQQRFENSNKSDTQLRQTYSNNFSNTYLGVGSKTIDGFILNIMFKPFVTPLIMMKKYLMSSENVALYGECRAFLTCIKKNHREIFRVTSLNRDLSDEADQVQTGGTDDISSSTFSIKLKRNKYPFIYLQCWPKVPNPPELHS
ncbi:unnamed protein product [Rotaria sp. Silwood2]|nr:unnamed protein product [Rotaria sp. Silwood2]CAF4509793.1 unnamed protein product [Rotaria sp. Silwood2]